MSTIWYSEEKESGKERKKKKKNRKKRHTHSVFVASVHSPLGAQIKVDTLLCLSKSKRKRERQTEREIGCEQLLEVGIIFGRKRREKNVAFSSNDIFAATVHFPRFSVFFLTFSSSFF